MRFLLKFTLTICSFFIVLHGFSQGSVETPLMKAVKANDLKEVTRLVTSGVDVNDSGNEYTDPVEYAVMNDEKEIALLLLKNGASGRGGFYEACRSSDIKWIETLLGYGFKDSEAMIIAAEKGNLALVKLLHEKGFSVHVSQKRKSGWFNKYYVTPIEVAIDNDHKEVALYLVDHGITLEEAIDVSWGNTVMLKVWIDRSSENIDAIFLKALDYGYLDIANHCLSKGANKNATNQEGLNGYLLAVKSGKQDLIHYAKDELKIDTNVLSAAKQNALMLACLSKNQALIKDLLDQVTNKEATDREGKTALFYAEDCELNDVFEMFLEKDFNLNHLNNDGNSVLLQACSNQNRNHIKLLVDKNVNFQVVNKKGQNVLTFLSKDNNLDEIKFFIDKGLSPNTVCSDGKTLAFQAIESADLELLEYLKSKGANLDPRYSDDRPTTKNPIVIKYIIENGGDVNATDSWNSTYMCIALEIQDYELAAYLITKKIDLQKSCYFDEPVLIKAIEKNDLRFIEFLVNNGADVNVIGYFDRNALEYAEKDKKVEIINYLRSKGAMSKEERNKQIVAQLEQNNLLVQHLEKQELDQALEILRTQKNLTLTPSQVQNMAVLSIQKASIELLQITMERYHFEINQKINFEEQTMLFLASKEGNLNLVTFLTNKGADVLVQDAFSKKASDYAKAKEVKSFLKEKEKPKTKK